MNEKFDYIWNTVRAAIDGLNTKKITVEQGKAIASLCKQANNVLTTQADVAKFMRNNKEFEKELAAVGLIEHEPA